MKIPDHLLPLVESYRRGEPGAEQRLRTDLAAGLVPLVCCTLKRGVGVPALVRFLNRARGIKPSEHGSVRAAPDPDPDRTAVRLARMLSVELIRQIHAGPRPPAETLVA
jgi:hypothetical protein